MKTGKTNQSATLRSGRGTQYEFLDRLEPGYPLIIHGEKDGWLDVTALAKGPRTKEQHGYISKELVTLDKPRHPPPKSEFDPRPWVIASVVIAVGVAIIILSATLPN